MLHTKGTFACDKEEVTILIPEKVDFRAKSISLRVLQNDEKDTVY